MSITPGITEQYQNFFSIDMGYKHGTNNNQIGKSRRRLTMIIVSRFGHTSPMIIRWLYGISQAQALVHLNKLCLEGLLDYTQTHRSPDDRVYVLTRAGALYAEQITGVQLHFRSSEQVSQRINLSTLYHDLIVQYVILRGMTEQHFQNGDSFNGWDSFITDAEFRKLARKHDIRNVDALTREPNGTLCALEFEHSFKTPENRKGILLKYSEALQAGVYEKIMLFSQKLDILKDARRINDAAIDYLTSHIKPKSNDTWLSEDNAQQLKAALVYRTKFCDELTERFYS